jgi:hypothetical protein
MFYSYIGPKKKIVQATTPSRSRSSSAASGFRSASPGGRASSDDLEEDNIDDAPALRPVSDV